MLITVKLSHTADTQTINAFLKCFHSYGCGRSHKKQTPPPDNRYITNKKCSMVKKKSFFLNPLFPGAFYDITPFFCFFLALMLVRLMQDSNFYILTPTETRETTENVETSRHSSTLSRFMCRTSTEVEKLIFLVSSDRNRLFKNGG